MKSILELVKILRKQITENSQEVGARGLCHAVSALWVRRIISWREEVKLSEWLDENLPPMKVEGMYCWLPGLIEPRKLWLEEKILELEAETE